MVSVSAGLWIKWTGLEPWPGSLCCIHSQVPLSTQECKWVLVNCWGKLTVCKDVHGTYDGLASHVRGTAMLTSSPFMPQKLGLSTKSNEPDRLKKRLWIRQLMKFSSRKIKVLTLVTGYHINLRIYQFGTSRNYSLVNNAQLYACLSYTLKVCLVDDLFITPNKELCEIQTDDDV